MKPQYKIFSIEKILLKIYPHKIIGSMDTTIHNMIIQILVTSYSRCIASENPAVSTRNWIEVAIHCPSYRHLIRKCQWWTIKPNAIPMKIDNLKNMNIHYISEYIFIFTFISNLKYKSYIPFQRIFTSTSDDSQSPSTTFCFSGSRTLTFLVDNYN